MDPLKLFMIVTLCIVGVVFVVCTTLAYRDDRRYREGVRIGTKEWDNLW